MLEGDSTTGVGCEDEWTPSLLDSLLNLSLDLRLQLILLFNCFQKLLFLQQVCILLSFNICVHVQPVLFNGLDEVRIFQAVLEVELISQLRALNRNDHLLLLWILGCNSCQLMLHLAFQLDLLEVDLFELVLAQQYLILLVEQNARILILLLHLGDDLGLLFSLCCAFLVSLLIQVDYLQSNLHRGNHMNGHLLLGLSDALGILLHVLLAQEGYPLLEKLLLLGDERLEAILINDPDECEECYSIYGSLPVA